MNVEVSPLANRNTSIVELLKFAPEADRAVVRPGQSDGFLNAVHVETRLELELAPAILAGEFDLVLVTGNPGDGKSAFLARFDEGSSTTNDSRSILCLHDATEPSDSADRSASALAGLEEFLRPFTLDHWDPSILQQRVHVVGINKGLLHRAFFASDSRFGHLGPAVRAGLDGAIGLYEGVRIVVVDLNRRGVAAVPLGSRGLLDSIVDNLTDEALWEESGCADCSDLEWCPFLANARALRSDLVRGRLGLLWLVQQLEAERHATLRDVLAALTYVLVGHEDMFREADSQGSALEHPCAFVEREAATADHGALMRRLLPNSVFVDGDAYEQRGFLVAADSHSAGMTFGLAPRLVAEHLNQLDPGTRVTSSWADDVERKVQQDWRKALEGVGQTSDGAGRALESSWLRALRDGLEAAEGQLESSEASTLAYREALREYHWLHLLAIRYLKRRGFFYDVSATPRQLTPYRYLTDYLSALVHPDQSDRQSDDYFRLVDSDLPRGLTRGEGITSSEEDDRLLLRWSASRSRVAAVLRLSFDEAKLEATPKPAPFLEASPRHLLLKASDEDSSPSLLLNLRIFESLMRLSDGYLESFVGFAGSDTVGAFRDALRAQPTSEMLLMDLEEPRSRVLAKFHRGQPIRFS